MNGVLHPITYFSDSSDSSDGSDSSDIQSGEGWGVDSTHPSMSPLIEKARRLHTLNVLQYNDPVVRRRLHEVWKDVMTDGVFLDAVAVEFERKDAHKAAQWATRGYCTRRVCDSFPSLSPPPLSYRF